LTDIRRVQIRIRVPTGYKSDIVRLGFPVEAINLNEATDDAVRQKLARYKSKTPGHPIFGPGNMGCGTSKVNHVLKDLKKLGYKLNGLELLLKPNDRMWFFTLWFHHQGERLNLSIKQREFIRKIFFHSFQYIHAYANPDQTLTLNLAHFLPVNNNPGYEIRILDHGNVVRTPISGPTLKSPEL
jgi:hypothetical protein